MPNGKSLGVSMRARLVLALSLVVLAVAACGNRPPDRPKPGTGFQGFASGSSYGSLVQKNDTYINTAILGEATPPPADGGVVQTGSGYQNLVGINAVQR